MFLWFILRLCSQNIKAMSILLSFKLRKKQQLESNFTKVQMIVQLSGLFVPH